MNTVKALSIDNWAEIEDSIRALPTHRIAQTRTDISLESFLKYTKTAFDFPGHVMYGFYKDDVLSSMMTIYNFEIMPAYVIRNWRNLKPGKRFNPAANGYFALWNRILDDQESKGLYEFYMMKSSVSSRLQLDWTYPLLVENCPRFLNYERTLEELVPANTKSKYSLHEKSMYLNKTIPEDTMVLKFTCRQRDRQGVPDNLQKELIMHDHLHKGHTE